jgi:hypothetical protein
LSCIELTTSPASFIPLHAYSRPDKLNVTLPYFEIHLAFFPVVLCRIPFFATPRWFTITSPSPGMKVSRLVPKTGPPGVSRQKDVHAQDEFANKKGSAKNDTAFA